MRGHIRIDIVNTIERGESWPVHTTTNVTLVVKNNRSSNRKRSYVVTDTPQFIKLKTQTCFRAILGLDNFVYGVCAGCPEVF